MRYSVSHAARLMIQQLHYKQKGDDMQVLIGGDGQHRCENSNRKIQESVRRGKERGIQRKVNCIADNIVLMRLKCSPKILASME